MSASSVDKALDRCRAAAIRTAWRQWAVLGGQVGGRFESAKAVIDPEALLLLSCALRDDEPRLWDIAAGFAASWCTLLSLQRTRNVAATFPDSVAPILAEIATIAVTVGKDARWRPLAGRKHRPFREGKVSDATRKVAEGAALMIRLRLAFGVHARTDALAFLIASAPAGATSREVAQATCYGEMPVRRGLIAIARSRMITGDGQRPERYHADRLQWSPLLQHSGDAPPWRHWHALFAFLAHVTPASGWPREGKSDYLVSSRARQLVLAHHDALTRNRVAVPEPSDYPGAEFIDGFVKTLASVEKWLDAKT